MDFHVAGDRLHTTRVGSSGSANRYIEKDECGTKKFDTGWSRSNARTDTFGISISFNRCSSCLRSTRAGAVARRNAPSSTTAS